MAIVSLCKEYLRKWIMDVFAWPSVAISERMERSVVAGRMERQSLPSMFGAIDDSIRYRHRALRISLDNSSVAAKRDY